MWKFAGLRKDSSNHELLLILNPSRSAFHFPDYLPACAKVSVSHLLAKEVWYPAAAGGSKSCTKWYVCLATEENWQQRVIYPVSSWRYEGNGSIKFLIRLPVETWDFFFLLAYCLTGDQMTVLARVSKSAKLSGCQHVCGAQEFDLVLSKTGTVCQSQFILYPYIQCRVSPSSEQVVVTFPFRFGEFRKENPHQGNIWAFPVSFRCLIHRSVMSECSPHSI